MVMTITSQIALLPKVSSYCKVIRYQPSARCAENLYVSRCVKQRPSHRPRGQPAGMPCEPFVRDRLSR
eukprot:5117965-Pyramimonas_sp.AAC.1